LPIIARCLISSPFAAVVTMLVPLLMRGLGTAVPSRSIELALC
jgi:hypothetical protein